MSRVSLLVAVACFALPSAAHELGLSQGTWKLDARGADIELRVSSAEVDALLADQVVVEDEQGACATELLSVNPDEDGSILKFRARCTSTPVAIEAAFTRALRPGHRHIAQIDEVTHALHARGARIQLDLDLEDAPAVPAYLGLGIEHILIGFDHLVFLFGLVLVQGRLRDILKMVSAFTVAHSITLALATLNLVSVDSFWIECVIALSVAVVGVENLFLRDASRRWRLTFVFGLVHGFGFAGVLGELGLPAGGELPALALFNVGVEIGQLFVLALLLPLLALGWRARWFRERGARALSVVVILCGLVWLVERLFGG